MASPFPGMDPYLEEFWRDVHASLVIYARDQLQGQLPGDLRARVEERVIVEPLEFDDEPRDVYPHIRVVERGRPRSGGGDRNRCGHRRALGAETVKRARDGDLHRDH